jgi:hypothetical protein
MVVFQFSNQLILFPFYSRKNEYEYNNKVSIFNQVTTFLAINFICTAIYFFIIRRVSNLNPDTSVIPLNLVIKCILFCVLFGLFIWFLFQKRELKSVTLLGLDIICLLLLYSSAIIITKLITEQMNRHIVQVNLTQSQYLAQWIQPYWAEHWAQYTMVCVIPVLLLLTIVFNRIISRFFPC